MQSRQKINDLIQVKAIGFESTNRKYPFDPDVQIGSDSVDLRLGEYFYTLKENYEYINTLNIDKNLSEKIFEKHEFSTTGYILKPQEIIFAPSLEIVEMSSSRFYGYVNGRSSYSRIGLSVNCTMTKFGYGMKSIVSLQIINNSPVCLKIYPRQKMIQMEIHEIYGLMDPYKGSYAEEREYLLPIIKDSELNEYSDGDRVSIKNDTPKEIKKRKKIDRSYIRKLDVYFKIKNIVTGILGPTALVSFIIELITNPTNPYLILVIIFSILLIADYMYSMIIFSNGVDSDEL